MSKNILLLMMGGSGTRFGADIPKQFVQVNGKPVFSYIVEKYAKLHLVDDITIVCHPSWIDYTQNWVENLGFDVPFRVTAGGDCRSASVRNGLVAARPIADDDDVVLIHDATHPYVDEEKLPAVEEATRTYGGATLGECQYDTVYGFDEETGLLDRVIPRQTVVSGASPEAFLFGRIYGIYTQTPDDQLEKFTSAGALALANDIPMKVIPTDLINLKITYKKDMEVFEKLFHDYYF